MATSSNSSLSADIKHSPLTEFDAGSSVRAIAISPDAKYLVNGNHKSIQVWQTEDGTRWSIAKTLMEEWLPLGKCRSYAVAISNDGKWIAAGTAHGWVYVWNAATFKPVSKFGEGTALDTNFINGVDFAPDATRLISVHELHSASIWDLVTNQPDPVRVLRHKEGVRAAKYSPQGDKIVTAGKPHSVRIWDNKGGSFLFDIEVPITPWYNKGLLWSDNNHILVVSAAAINEFDATTGAALPAWPVPRSDESSCLALLNRGEIIAHSTDRSVTLWDISTRTKLGLIQDQQKELAIAPFPDGRSLAIGGDDGKITICGLSFTTDSTSSRPPPTSEELDIPISAAALDLWKNDRLTDADALLTASISNSWNPDHFSLASRSLIRARLRHSDAALADAEQAIEYQPSPIGYIAKSVAHVGSGERDKGYMVCDAAIECFPSHAAILCLMKAIVMFMAGEHEDAISHVDSLITKYQRSIYNVVQKAYMYLRLGDQQIKQGSCKAAVRSLKLAQTQMRHDTSRPLFVISLITGWKFDDLSIEIQRYMCEALYAAGDTANAVDCFHKITGLLGKEIHPYDGYLEWASGFKERVVETSVRLGDIAAEAQRYDDAISHYTTAVSINPFSKAIIVKQYKAFQATSLWMRAADAATQIIALDPLSLEGYELKHAALHAAGDYERAVKAFEQMLLRIAESPDANIRRRGDDYVDPSNTRARIRKCVNQIVPHLPHTLIDTKTGHLHNRASQISVFESSPVFHELVSSMTTCLDKARIKREVNQYFRYVMLSHRWEDKEPLFQQVVHVSVYDLDESRAHEKLKRFCEIVQDAGFNWAWSDTCCINKLDNFILQEALVVMFKWYEEAAMTIVFLRGVRSTARRGALVGSIWNTRAWTLQEYIASRLVRFYTEEWTPYLDLKLPNHKESPEIISEMEEATRISAQQLRTLRPGLSSIREKLRLASTRETTVVEDAAYSLLGILSVAGITANYGERDSALGRLLAHVLAGSGDVSILAWTGESGSYNSCLPSRIVVFDGPATSHLPQPIPTERATSLSQSTSLDVNKAMALYDHLNRLPSPWFTANRMKLPCIAFQLPRFSRSKHLCRVETPAFGVLEIQTKFDLSRIESLCLVHPWLNTLLEPQETLGMSVEDVMPPRLPMTDDSDSDGDIDDEASLSARSPITDEDAYETASEDIEDDSPSLSRPRSLPRLRLQAPVSKETRARRFMARLRRPFGALLLAPVVSEGGRTVAHRRIAADSMITVQLRESVLPAEILDNVRTLDVL